jgi:hypothetical protein
MLRMKSSKMAVMGFLWDWAEQEDRGGRYRHDYMLNTREYPAKAGPGGDALTSAVPSGVGQR